MQVPPEWVSLYMLQKPKNGGDTLFASTVGAYERLTPDQKKLVDSLEVVNRYVSYSLPACETKKKNS